MRKYPCLQMNPPVHHTTETCSGEGEEELLSGAKELARALDKLLVESLSPVSVEGREWEIGEKEESVGGAIASEEGEECQIVEEESAVDSVKEEVTAESGYIEVDELPTTQPASDDGSEWDAWGQSPADAFGSQCSNSNNNDGFFANSFTNESEVVAPQSFAKPSPNVVKKPPRSVRSAQSSGKKPKIKICIGGAPSLKLEEDTNEKDSSSIFFFSQSSPRCGDDACLLEGRDSLPEAQSADEEDEKSGGTQRTTRLNIKGFFNGALPPKTPHGCHSPSMAGLLSANHNDDENVGFFDIQNITLAEEDTGFNTTEHFFVGQASPTSQSLVANTPSKRKTPKMKLQSKANGSPASFKNLTAGGNIDWADETAAVEGGVGGGKKTKAFLRRMKAPLSGRKSKGQFYTKSGFGEL
jgi:hypothetical protein